jgi:hypothetical protein
VVAQLQVHHIDVLRQAALLLGGDAVRPLPRERTRKGAVLLPRAVFPVSFLLALHAELSSVVVCAVRAHFSSAADARGPRLAALFTIVTYHPSTQQCHPRFHSTKTHRCRCCSAFHSCNQTKSSMFRPCNRLMASALAPAMGSASAGELVEAPGSVWGTVSVHTCCTGTCWSWCTVCQ